MFRYLLKVITFRDIPYVNVLNDLKNRRLHVIVSIRRISTTITGRNDISEEMLDSRCLSKKARQCKFTPK